jgi:polygalacturonase
MHTSTSRRRFLLAGGAAATALAMARDGFAAIGVDDAWARAADIVRSISAPVFPARVFDITEFGARAGGAMLNTVSIAKAIDACAAQGGGRVFVPEGTFLTGAIHLRSNVELHVSKGATLLFDTNPRSYPIVFTR